MALMIFNSDHLASGLTLEASASSDCMNDNVDARDETEIMERRLEGFLLLLQRIEFCVHLQCGRRLRQQLMGNRIGVVEQGPKTYFLDKLERDIDRLYPSKT